MNVPEYLDKNPEWRAHPDLLVVSPTYSEVAAEFDDCHSADLVAAEGMRTSFGPGVLAMYVHIRRMGKPHRMAEMIALQAAPRIMTDSVFFEGKKRLGDELNYLQLPVMEAACKRQGFRPNSSDVYVPALARFPYDKEAFVPATGGRGHIKKLCEERGWSADGAVTVKGRQQRPKPDKPMSDQVVVENILRHVKKNPDLARKPVRELKEMVIEKHGLKSALN